MRSQADLVEMVTVPRYPVLVSQLAASLQLPLLGKGRSAAIVLVHDPYSRPRKAEEILQVGLGLTPGAARLVAALAADDDPKHSRRVRA